MRYQILADSLYVERDQRTGTVNWEGLLELRARFWANNVSVIYPSGSSFISAAQDQHIDLNLPITTVENLTTVPIRAEIWELEPGGGQGKTDYGELAGNISLAGWPPQATQDLTVTVSADTWRERSARIRVRFKAVRL